MTLSRTEMKIVALVAVVMASMTYKLVERVVAMVPVVKTLAPTLADPTMGLVAHVVVMALAVKYVLPRM